MEEQFDQNNWPIVPPCSLFQSIKWGYETEKFGGQSSAWDFDRGNHQTMSITESIFPIGSPDTILLRQLDKTREKVRCAIVEIPKIITAVIKYYEHIDAGNLEQALEIFDQGEETSYNRWGEKLSWFAAIRDYYTNRRKLSGKHNDYFGTLTCTGNFVNTVWTFVCTDGREIAFSDQFEFNDIGKVIRRTSMFENPGVADG